MMFLPNELLESIIDLLAYNPKFPDSDYSCKTRFQQASPELHALSVVNWHLRQICLRFLFANIQIRSLKILVISFSFGYSEELLVHDLPDFKQLSYVELQSFNISFALLNAILAHPTVSSVLVDQIPHESIYDLSKVILREASPSNPDLKRCMDRGMRLTCLMLLQPGSLNDKLPHFEGLEGIHMILGPYHISSSWLSALSSTNPSLKELWLFDYHEMYLGPDTITIMSSFLEEFQRRNLDKKFIIRRACLRRSTVQDWHIIELTICTTSACTSLVEILTLIASSFPKLEALTLDLYLHAYIGIYDAIHVLNRNRDVDGTLRESKDFNLV
ncbi:hypothetical protein GGU11DRAFT_759949 [Lentinula aff. detonsa]|nr:hypothetical protein GGU11DRAFT_759949 [Lentinula aff. detonsa]